MHFFDRIDPLMIERRHAKLWMLAIFSIVILASGIALLLYPSAFLHPVAISGPAMRTMFFSFCVLSALLVSYLIDRHVAIEELRRRLLEQESRTSNLIHQASIDLLDILPNFEHFQDRLAMEFRRATLGLQPLSLIAVLLTPRGLSDKDELTAACGDAVKLIIQRLRREDSIYQLREGVFGVILPGASTSVAGRVADRLAQGLQGASETAHSVSFELKVINYPDHACSAREIENLARSAFPLAPVLLQAA